MAVQWEGICLPMQETLVQSLGQEDPLEEEMATHSSILAWEIPWPEKSGGLQSMGHKQTDKTEHRSSSMSCIIKHAQYVFAERLHFEFFPLNTFVAWPHAYSTEI